jgi:hypothetical protein
MTIVAKEIILDQTRHMVISQSATCHKVFRLNLIKLGKTWQNMAT